MKHLIPFLAMATAGLAAEPSAGELWRVGGEAAPCPLEHTAVTADLSGPVGRVRVKQIFRNPLSEPLEALYTFPLSARGAVDEMTIRINDRVVKGQIKRKEEARRIYEQAKQQGKLTGLLDQKRPNVFTQRLANIPPGARVEVEISYVETLQYEAGRYEFVFPMTVGPRYKAKYNPAYAAKGVRAGHDLSLRVNVNGVTEMESPTHEVVRERTGVALRNQKEIPNRDFILRYKVAGPSIKDTLLAHREEGTGHFTLLLAPPERTQPAEVTPKELVFVIDTSGSMHGYPLDKAKEAMSAALAGLHPRDTFNLITFSGDTHLLFPKPVPATPENLAAAQRFLQFSRSGGGTEMMKAIRAALEPTASQEHLRVVCFMTDGYVGNEPQILAEIERYSNARIFSFGIGSSVNRYLLDEMAARGRGEVEYVGLQDDGSAAARRFHQRVHTPLLTDIRVDWGNLPVKEVYPQRVPDLFDAKPVVLTGQFSGPARGEMRILGKMAGRPFERKVWVDLPGREAANTAVPALWARTKIDTLRDAAAITELGLAYGLMTQYTSFVAVEEGTVSGPGGRLIEVPVEMPDGVSHDHVMSRSAPMAAGMGMGVGRVHESRKVMEPERQEAMAPVAPVVQAAPKVDPLLAARVQGMGPLEKVGVRVFLSDGSEAVMAALKNAGFVIAARPGGGLLVIGEIAAGRLAELSRLGAVKRVALR
jgi:Ca-activated chloride channel homolog